MSSQKKDGSTPLKIALAVLTIAIIAAGFMIYQNQQKINQLESQVEKTRTQNPGPLVNQEENQIEKIDAGMDTEEETSSPQLQEPINQNIDWRTYNYEGVVQFSMNIPYPGDYCNGCFGGLSDPSRDPNVSGNRSISGGYDDPTTEPNWRLQINYTQNGADTDILSYGLDDYDNITLTESGFETGADRTVTIGPATPVSVKSVSSSNDTLAMQNAVIGFFEKDGYTFTLIFQHDDSIPARIFDDILNSIEFTLIEGADYP